MSLREFLNDRVTLIKKDGRRFENLPASVQSGKIFTNDPKIPIEDGDWFERTTPSGVINPISEFLFLGHLGSYLTAAPTHCRITTGSKILRHLG